MYIRTSKNKFYVGENMKNSVFFTLNSFFIDLMITLPPWFESSKVYTAMQPRGQIIISQIKQKYSFASNPLKSFQ